MFCKRAAHYRALLQKKTYEDKASLDSTPYKSGHFPTCTCQLLKVRCIATLHESFGTSAGTFACPAGSYINWRGKVGTNNEPKWYFVPIQKKESESRSSRFEPKISLIYISRGSGPPLIHTCIHIHTTKKKIENKIIKKHESYQSRIHVNKWNINRDMTKIKINDNSNLHLNINDEM